MSNENQLAVTEFPKASTALSLQLGLEPRVMIDALKSQFFKGKEATDAQLAVVVSIAKELKLNPLLPGQLYPYPDRTGSVVVMIGPDGIYTMLANNSDIVAQKDGGPAFYVEHGMENGKETCTAYINHKTKGLLKKTIWVDEWVVSSNPNWSSRRHHMAEIRALKQAARLVIHGIPADSDEHAIGEMLNVTPEAEAPKVERPEPPARKPRGAKAVQEVVVPAETAPAPAPEAPKADPVPEQTALATTPPPEGKVFTQSSTAATKDAPAPHMPKLTLKDKETLAGTVKVIDSGAFLINVNGVPTPSVKAQVEGDYKGLVYHKGGGVAGADGKPAIPPLWSVGSVLKVTLVGFLNMKLKDPETQKPYPEGKLQTFVESAEVVAQETEGMDA